MPFSLVRMGWPSYTMDSIALPSQSNGNFCDRMSSFLAVARSGRLSLKELHFPQFSFFLPYFFICRLTEILSSIFRKQHRDLR